MLSFKDLKHLLINIYYLFISFSLNVLTDPKSCSFKHENVFLGAEDVHVHEMILKPLMTTATAPTQDQALSFWTFPAKPDTL